MSARPGPGEWAVVGWDHDPVHGGDLARVSESRTRYVGISQTIDSAVARLDKLVAQSGEGLAGQYADELREDAGKVRDQLAKAAVRYEDVAREVSTYEPELDHALTQTQAGLVEAQAAATTLAAAEALPDGQADETGDLGADEVAKDAHKRNEIATADGDVLAAKRRVQSAFDRLQVAGKQLGDAVNSKNYDDGLSDSGWDKFVAVLKVISKALAIIAMVLAVLCFIFPGVALLVLASVVVAVAAVAVAGILYAEGEEGLPDLLFAIAGVVLLGGATIASLVGRNIGNAARAARIDVGHTLPGIPLNSFGPGGQVIPTIGANAAKWVKHSDWFDNPLTKWAMQSMKAPGLVPEVGLWGSSVQQLKTAFAMWPKLLQAPGQFLKEWSGVLGGWGGFRNIAQLGSITGQATSNAWWVWGGFNSIFTIGTGLVFTGLRLTDVVPQYGTLGGDE